MARIDRFMIAPITSGQQTNLKPWLIPDDAFSQLRNAYVFRGRIIKRFGARLMQGSSAAIAGYEQLTSRLSINIGTTNAITGNFSGTVPGTKFKIGQMFSVGSQIYTVYQNGAPASMLNTGAGTGTFDTTGGAVVIVGAATATAVYFYPAEPVMGLINYEQAALSYEPVIAFDTQFAYQFTASGWDRLGSAVWTGSDSQFFWGTNWRGVSSDQTFLFVSNYNSDDLIKYYDPTGSPVWTSFSPIADDIYRVSTAKIILPFKGRLILLNTIENAQGVQFSNVNTDPSTGNFDQTVAGSYSIGQQFIVGNTILTIASVVAGLQNMTVAAYPDLDIVATAQFDVSIGRLVITGNGTNRGLPVYFFDGITENNATFSNRCRFSLDGNPVLTNGWVTSPGLGNYIDAPTKDSIVTAQFLKDRLIVYFTKSTWELVFTGNQVLPFIWQQINTELGAESTFSQIPFDKVVLGIGNIGIHACNGSNVERIDNNIPDTVFEIHNIDEGPQRVYGIRDYFAETVYWSYPFADQDSTNPYPNQVLVYNYKTNSWAINDDSITAFGYYQANTDAGETWAQAQQSWQSASYPWVNAPLQAQFRNVIAGNQQGFVFIVSSTGGDDDGASTTNCQSLQITNLVAATATFTVINHNLVAGSFVKVMNCQGITSLNNSIVKVNSVVDKDTFTIVAPTLSGTYTGAGTLVRVTPPNILTKQYNFYVQEGRNAYISKVDFLVTKTSFGEFMVDFATSSSNESLVNAGELNGSIVGTSIVETRPYTLIAQEQNQSRLWHPLYLLAEGECVQLNIYLTDEQAMDVDIAESEFEIHGFTFYTTKTSSRLQ